MDHYNPDNHGYKLCQYYLTCDSPQKKSVMECPTCGQFWLIKPKGDLIDARKLTMYESTVWLRQGRLPQ